MVRWGHWSNGPKGGSGRMVSKAWSGITGALACTGALLAGCGGGDGSGALPWGAGAAGLTIVSSDPADGAQDVGLSKATTVSFSALLDASTVGPETFKLSSDQAQVEGTLTVDGSTITLTPVQRLSQSTRYQLQIGGLRGISGRAFAGATLNFTTCDRAWRAPQPAVASLMSPQLGAVQYDLDADGRGNAVLVWTEYHGWWFGGEAWATRYDSTTGGWGPPISLRTQRPGVQQIDVAMDAQGNAVAVWSEGNGGGQIWAKRYEAATGTWTASTRIDTGLSSNLASGARVVLDQRGNAFVTWSNDGIWSARYDADTGVWGAATQVAARGSRDSNVRVAVDQQGGALLVWQTEESSGQRGIWASLYKASANSWAASQLLTSSNVRAEGPVVAMDGLGNAFAGWQQSGDGVQTTLWFRRFDKSTALWSDAIAIGNGEAPQREPTLTVDGRGNALVAWTQGQATPRIWTNRYDAQAGRWEAPTTLMDLDSSGGIPNIASDAQGNAVLVWQQRNMVWFSRYSAATLQWTAPGRVTLNTPADRPLVAIDKQGKAITVWRQTGSNNTVLASSHLAAGQPQVGGRYCEDPLPPGG
jgi:hypothetical protein